MWGTERLTARDGYKGVRDGYYVPVETYISQHYTVSQIDEALANGYLNQQEYDEIISLTNSVPQTNTPEQ
jgi:hypothetical protein